MDKQLSILVIEDSKIFLNLIRKLIEGHNYIYAETGEEGIDLYKSHIPQITFLDIELPDIDGYEVLKQIKQQNEKAYVIIVTSHRNPELIQKALEYGASGYIMKPYSAHVLQQHIEQYYTTLLH